MFKRLFGWFYRVKNRIPKDGLVVYRVRRIGTDKVYLTKEVTDGWIKDCEKYYKEHGGKFSVRCIYGEVSESHVIEAATASEYCELVEVLFGPKLKNEQVKRNLAGIMVGSNGWKLKLISANQRPEWHGLRIGKNRYLYEDKHDANQPFDWATIAIHFNDESSADSKEAFDKYYDDVKSNAKPVNIDNIGSIQTII